jgi:diguanylate cyclase (GGDEF)-like protein
MLAGAGLTIAAAWAGLELNDLELEAYLLGVPALAAIPAWLARRSARRHVSALSRAAEREHVLAELGTALLTVTDAAGVHRLAARAAADLIAGCPDARASVAVVENGVFTLTESAGDGADGTARRRFPVADLPAGLAGRLTAGEVITDPDMGGAGRSVLLLPVGATATTVLCVSADELTDGVRRMLLALRTQLSLALDGVSLTAELTRRASYDALTGLANRALFRERLTASLARARRSGRPVAALMLDLDGFKQVNDAHGHEVGDRVLCAVADRLRDCVRTEDVVGRLGGDEFVVLAEDLRSARDATVIAERMVAAMREPVMVGRGPLRVPISIGIALSRSGTDRPDELLRLADAAMYVAKRRGGGYQLDGAAAPVPALA